MTNGGNEEVFIIALRWQAKLAEHVAQWELDFKGEAEWCRGCRAYAAAMMRGRPVAEALRQGCDTIRQARDAMNAARDVAIGLGWEPGF